MFTAQVKFSNEKVEKDLKRAEEIIKELHMISMRLYGFLNLEVSEVQSNEENTSESE